MASRSSTKRKSGARAKPRAGKAPSKPRATRGTPETLPSLAALKRARTKLDAALAALARERRK